MDADGIDAAFLYPSLGLFAGAVEIPNSRPRRAAPTTAGSPTTASPTPTACSASRCCRCNRSSLATEELRFAKKELGMRGGFLRPNPYHGKKMISDPIYDHSGRLAEELDFSIGFHEGSTTAMPTSASTASKDRAARHIDLAHDGDDAGGDGGDLGRRR